MFMDPLFLTQEFVIKLLLLISYEGPSQSGPKEKDGLLVPLGKVYTLLTDNLITGKRSGLNLPRKSGSSQTIHPVL